VLGKSHEGRDIALVVITNSATGDDADKPALWVDGNIHAAELTGLHGGALLPAPDWWRLRQDAAITRLLDTRTVYLVPAPEPRRRRAGAGRQAAPHPLHPAAIPSTSCRWTA
jgi:hypothetical protein